MIGDRVLARFVAALGATSLLCLSLIAQAADTLTLGMFSYRPKPVLEARYQPLADYLSSHLGGVKVRLVVLDQAELEREIAQNRIDLLFTNPAHYIRLRTQNTLSGVLATRVSMESGEAVASLGGVIVTRAPEREIRGLADLKHRRIAIPGTSFLGAYQIQAMELQEIGIHLPRDARLVPVGNQDAVVEAVLSGRAQVGFLRTGVLEEIGREGRVDVSRLRVVNPQRLVGFPYAVSTRLYPEWPLVALPWVDPQLTRKISAALLSLEPHHPASMAMGIAGFMPPADYLPVENLARALGLPPFVKPVTTWRDIWQEHRYELLGLLLFALALIVLLNLLMRRNRALARSLDTIELSEKKHRTYIEHSPEGIVVTDRDARVCDVSPSACALLGYGRDELLQLHLFDLVSRQDLERSWTPYQQVSHARALEVELRLCRKDGSERTFALRSIRLPDDKIMSFCTDITARKRVEDAREEARVAAEKLAQTKSQFLANMSHEIRTPINAVLGFARIGARDCPDAAQRSHFQHIAEAGNHLLGVVNDILDYSKVEAGKFQIEASPFRLQTLIDNTRKLMSQTAEFKGLDFSVILPEPLPEWVQGDAQRLLQILTNLLSNACKFTSSGLVQLKVQRVGEQMRFTVTDTGIGMQPAEMERLFKPFEQVDASSTRRFGGTGLGLAISQSLARLMGGEITAHSVPGVGSTFTLALPLPELAPPDMAGHGLAPELPGTDSRCLTGLNILAAEDERFNQMILEDTLVRAGARCTLVDNGLAAVQRVDDPAQHFDLVLMDIQMPEMDGHAATREITARHPHLPIIGLTAHALAEERAKCLASGMVEHLAKPIDPRMLFAAILRVLGRPFPPPEGDAETPPAQGERDGEPLGQTLGKTFSQTFSEPFSETPSEPVNVTENPTETPSAPTGNLIDWPQFEARHEEQPGFAQQLVQALIRSHAGTANTLRQLAAAEDFEALRALAHRLKGLTGQLGVPALQDQAARVEASAKQASPDTAPLAETLAQQMTQLIDELSHHR